MSNPRHQPDLCCTLAPYFRVRDEKLEEFKQLGERFVARTQTEAGCVHYAFAFNGNVAYCREGYDDAAALLSHLQNVDALLAEALKIAELIRLEIHGPAAEIAKLEAPLADLRPEFFALEPGLRRS